MYGGCPLCPLYPLLVFPRAHYGSWFFPTRRCQNVQGSLYPYDRGRKKLISSAKKINCNNDIVDVKQNQKKKKPKGKVLEHNLGERHTLLALLATNRSLGEITDYPFQS